MAHIPHYNLETVEQDALRYTRAAPVINELHRHAAKLSTDEYKELRRQALRGDIDGARQRLQMLVWTRG